MHMPTKKYLRKKAIIKCLMGQIVIKSPSFLEYRQNRSRDTGLVQGTVSVQWVGGFGNWPRPLTC